VDAVLDEVAPMVVVDEEEGYVWLQETEDSSNSGKGGEVMFPFTVPATVKDDAPWDSHFPSARPQTWE
jgi:hypothetical protein